MACLQTEPIDLGVLAAGVQEPSHGALVVFAGMVRDHHAGRRVVGLEYSAYLAMAEAVCADIIAETEARWPVTVQVAHRLGRLEVGEAAVVAVAAGGHREEAFMACQHCIDEIKARVPIWKREFYDDGSEAWVDPTKPGETNPVAPPFPEGPAPR